MNYSRRAWLQAMAAMTMAARTGRAAASRDIEARVTRLVQAYSDQGVHRTATDVDTRRRTGSRARSKTPVLPHPAKRSPSIASTRLKRSWRLATGGTAVFRCSMRRSPTRLA